MSKYIFISGMPRSGSELLINLLAQNPDIYPGKPSGLLPTLIMVRNDWDKMVEHQSIPWDVSDLRKIQSLRALVNGYWNVGQPYVIDSNRGWLAHIELVENVLEEQVKIIVPVRDLREILASCENLWRTNSAWRQISQEQKHYVDMQTVFGRCKVWMQDDEFVGIAYNRINDAIQRGYGDRLHFAHFERLTSDPEATLAGIYHHLQIPFFEHDFRNVTKVTDEDDRVHGIRGLHDIRPDIEPVPPKRHMLGNVADKYKGPYVWDVEGERSPAINGRVRVR